MVTAYRPKGLHEALRIREETGAIPLAGGTDLMVAKRRRAGISPGFNGPVVFIGGIEELRAVCMDRGMLRIGCATTFTNLLKNPAIPEIFKSVFTEIASPAVRNRATIGGNICNASPAGDTLPLLYALDASVVLERVDGKRILSIDEFITGSGDTVLKEKELLTEIRVPLADLNLYFYRKIGTRQGYSCSKVSFLGLARLTDGRLEDVRMALGSVAPTVVRSKEAEKRIKNKNDRELEILVPEIVAIYDKIITPIDDQRSTACYRKNVSLRLVRHFLYNNVLPEMRRQIK